jgi:hypothetical protein
MASTLFSTVGGALRSAHCGRAADLAALVLGALMLFGCGRSHIAGGRFERSSGSTVEVWVFRRGLWRTAA